MLLQAVALLLLSFSQAKSISGVFTDIDSIIYAGVPGRSTTSDPYLTPDGQPASTQPDGFLHDPTESYWNITLNWNIPNNAAYGDTFTLTMPCVFSFGPIDGNLQLVNPVVGETWAECETYGGEIIVPYSQLNCKVVTQPVYFIGDSSLQFPVILNAGSTEQCAQVFADMDSTQIMFSDGSNSISKTVQFVNSNDYESNDVISRNQYISQLDTNLNYHVPLDCPTGYKNLTIGIEVSSSIDPLSIKQGYSNNFNPYMFPMSYTETYFEPRVDDDNVYYINFGDIPAGNRPFVTVLAPFLDESVYYTYYNNYVCGSSKMSYKSDILVDQDEGSNNAVNVIVTTSTWADSTTSVSTLPQSNDAVATIVVLVPTATETITYSGSTTFTNTMTPTNQDGGTTIEVVVPTPTVTKTITVVDYLTTSTAKFVAASEGTATITVYVPIPTETITSTWSREETYSVVWPATVPGLTAVVQLYVPTKTMVGDIIEASDQDMTLNGTFMSSDGNEVANTEAAVPTNSYDTTSSKGPSEKFSTTTSILSTGMLQDDSVVESQNESVLDGGAVTNGTKFNFILLFLIINLAIYF